MDATLTARIKEILGASTDPKPPQLVILMTLDSGGVLAIDGTASFVITPDGGAPTPFSDETPLAFVEVLEGKRDDFESALAAAATKAGLSGDAVVAAFPAIPLIRAVLAKQFGYTTRLALLWLRPSELRDLREVIVEVTETKSIPGPVKDLARRLVVPKEYGGT